MSLVKLPSGFIINFGAVQTVKTDSASGDVILDMNSGEIIRVAGSDATRLKTWIASNSTAV